MKKLLLSLVALMAIGISAWADGLSIADAEVMPGQTTIIQLYLENTSGTKYRDFGFTFNLPEGLTRDVSKDGITPGENLQEAAQILPGGQTLVMCVPDQDAVDAGLVDIEDYYITKSGVLLNIRLQASSDLATGTVLEGSLISFELSDEFGQAAIRTEVPFKVKIVDYVLLDEESTIAPIAADNVTVKVKRTINAGEWSTICLPFDIYGADVAEIFGTDAQFAIFTSYSKDGGLPSTSAAKTAESIVLNFETQDWSEDGDDGIFANTPYLVKTTKDIKEFSLTGVTLNPTESPKTEVKRNGSGGRVVGSFNGTTKAGDAIPENGLFLSGGNFWYSKGLTKIKGFRGYFVLNDVLADLAAAGVKMQVSVDGEPTGVNDLHIVNAAEGVFTIDGKKMNNDATKLQKGVYIIDGKKVAIK